MSLKSNKKKKPNHGRWARGTSGNPAGRPVGSRNRSTVFYEQLLNGQGEALFQKAIELALAGDATALRLCLERISPPRKERTIDLPLPKVTGVAILERRTTIHKISSLGSFGLFVTMT